jgi:hypothetical protein
MRRRILGSASVVLLVTLSAACGGGSGPTGPSGPPVVASVNGATLPAGPVGSTIVIEGSSFGTTQAIASGTVLFSNGSGGTVAGTIASASDWSDTFIITTVPTGAATGNLTVQTSKGTSTPVTFTVSQSAAFSPSAISWTSTSTLPVGLSGHDAAFVEIRGATTMRVVYVVGGADSTRVPRTTVYYATVGGSGTLSGWTATMALPAARAFSEAVVATAQNSSVSGAGYLYVLGGATDSTGAPSTTVYRGTIASDGTISGWTTLSQALPAPLHSFGAAIFFGNLYIWGGSTTGNVPVNTVYRSSIDASGGLGTWKAEPALPTKRAYFAYGAFTNYLYALGGDSGTVAPNDASLTATRMDQVTYAKIDLKTRDITAAGWAVNATALGKTRSKHTAAVADGSVLVTAGLYVGASPTGSSEESYAGINADGSIGSFAGATGANTISAGGGGNVFNQAETGYTDGSGAFHILVAGGDDVGTPGTKHKTVFYY